MREFLTEDGARRAVAAERRRCGVDWESLRAPLPDVNWYIGTMMSVVPTEHPHIVRGSAGGEPVVADTGISVRAVVELLRLYADPVRVGEALPDLSLGQIYDALSYYHDHREEVEGWITRNEEKANWLMPGRGATPADAERLVARVRKARRDGWRPPAARE